MLPKGKSSQKVSEVTGLKVVRGKLVHKSVALTTKLPNIVEFMAFLKSCGQQVLFAGHNIRNFDAPRT